jgi:hypothetical protein
MTKEDIQKFREFIDFVNRAPVESGVCWCGEDMTLHSDWYYCDHHPIDQWNHSLMLYMEEINPILDKLEQEV